jgi:hypothetical protein
MADTADLDEERNPSLTAAAPKSNTTYLTSHLTTHIATTHHHLTGAPEPPEPPYAPSFHPPTGYWTSAEKGLFFHALSTYSRLRPDLIAASIGTKSTADVAVYLALLHEGTKGANKGGGGVITREQHPAAYEVSHALVAFEDTQAAHICAAEPARAEETNRVARAKAARAMLNEMRPRRDERQVGQKRDREGERERRVTFERWRAERRGEWDKEDVLGRLDAARLMVMDRVLRLDEERRGKEQQPQRLSVAGPSSTTHRRQAASYATEPDISFPPTASHDSDDVGDDDSGTIQTDLSPASRRRIYKRLYMRRKRAEATGGIAQLDHVRLKPGRKASATSTKSKQHEHEKGDDERNSKQQKQQNMGGETLPYKVQRELEQLGISADYLRENGLGLFHLGALGRLMRCVPSYPVRYVYVLPFLAADK